MQDSDRSEVVFLGGRSGVGKTSVAAEMHSRLSAHRVKHAVIEGDALDLAWPAPWEHELAERNLAAVWRNYRDLGYRKLVFTNTMSVVQQHELATAMGDNPQITAILLQCDNETARTRLSEREIGSELNQHLQRSMDRAIQLEQTAPSNVIRIQTDERSVRDIADQILSIVGWGTNTEDNDNE